MNMKKTLKNGITNVITSPIGVRLIQGTILRRKGGYILCYHSESKSVLEQQIDSLYPDTPIPLSEMVERIKTGKSTMGLFSITVDDGEKEAVEGYSEVCLRREWPITFYLLTDYINTGEAYYYQFRNVRKNLPLANISVGNEIFDMTTEAKRSQIAIDLENRFLRSRKADFYPFFQRFTEILLAEGMITEEIINNIPPPVQWEVVERLSKNRLLSFESHGVLHQPVQALPADEFEDDLVYSKREIEDHTGIPVKHFCYPYGVKRAIGDADTRIVAKHYESAVTLDRRRIANCDLYKIPRIGAGVKTPQQLRLNTYVEYDM